LYGDFLQIAGIAMYTLGAHYWCLIDGKVVSEATISADGNTLTWEFKDYPVEGQPVTGEEVMTRVSAGPAGSHAISGSWRTQKVEISEAGLTYTLKSTAGGLAMKIPPGESYDAKFDGKDYPVKGDRAGVRS
jgi:hypothetical protein